MVSFSLTTFLIASTPGANNLRGSKPLDSKSLPASIYLRVASANANCNSVLTLILVTPKEMAVLIMCSGIPVPPCNTRGTLLVTACTSLRTSKFKPFQFAGYLP